VQTVRAGSRHACSCNPRVVESSPRQPMIDYRQTTFGLVHRAVSILDTKAAVNAVCHHVAVGRPGRLERAIAHGAPVLIPRHVLRETDEKLEERALKQRLDPNTVRGTWRHVLLPHLRVVDLAIRDYLDPLLRPVLVADRDDVATVALAMLVGPAVVLSDDHHIVDHGFADKALWVQTVLDVLLMAEADEQVMSVYFGVNASVNGVGAGLAAGVRLASRQPLAAVLALGAVLVGAGLVVRRHPALVTTLGDAGKALLGHVAMTFAFHQNVSARLLVVEPPRHRTPDLEQRCARILARSTSLSVTGLQQRLVGHRPQQTPTAAEIRRTLQGHPAFVKVARDRWQLGHRSLPAGGDATPEVPTNWRSPLPLALRLGMQASPDGS
jgi:hypothetical protein